MTAEEWQTCIDPRSMLEFLWGKSSERKLRLFAAACCRKVWDTLTDERSRKSVEVAECYADGLAAKESLERARDAAGVAFDESMIDHDDGERQVRPGVTSFQCVAACTAAMHISNMLLTNFDSDFIAIAAAHASSDVLAHLDYQVQVLRDIFGRPLDGTSRRRARWLKTAAVGLVKLFAGSPNHSQDVEPESASPWASVPVDPSWLTSTVLSLARQMYESRDFSTMPILADALQDAGCGNDDILAHCRGPGPHVKGCWALDLVLAKS